MARGYQSGKVILGMALVGALLAPSAFAETAKPKDTADRPSVEVVEDPQTGVVRIVVGGRDVLVIDETGVQINGDLRYRGTMVDIGDEQPSAP